VKAKNKIKLYVISDLDAIWQVNLNQSIIYLFHKHQPIKFKYK